MPKTVNEIYSLTKTAMFEKPSSSIYDDYIIGNLNMVLDELFKENNMDRMFNNKPPLKEVPYVVERTDVVDYEDVYLNRIIPLGLAASFFIDDDLNKYSIYDTKYQNARILNQKIVSQEVIDGFATNTEV